MSDIQDILEKCKRHAVNNRKTNNMEPMIKRKLLDKPLCKMADEFNSGD